MNYATWKTTVKIETPLQKSLLLSSIFFSLEDLFDSIKSSCLFYSVQWYFLLVKTSLLSHEQLLHWIVLFCPSESPLLSLWPWGSYSTCFFMNHLGKFPRVLKHSQEAEEMLKSAGKKLLGGSEECQRRSGNIKPKKALNTCLEVIIMSQPKLQNAKVRKLLRITFSVPLH